MADRMRWHTVDYQRRDGATSGRALVNVGWWLHGTPRLMPLCRLLGHKAVVEGVDHSPRHTNEREGMAPRSWTVATGTRRLEWEPCEPSSRLPRCPDTERNWCGGWHGLWTPIPGLVVDDVVEQVPAGALVRLDTKSRQGVILATPADRDQWIGEQQDRARTSTPVPAQRRASTTNWHADYSSAKLRRRISADQPSITARRVGTCTNCHEMPAGINSTVCTRCFFFPEKFRARDA